MLTSRILPTLQTTPKRTLSLIHTARTLSGRFGKYKIVKVANVSPTRHVPEHIQRPTYCINGVDIKQEQIEIKSDADIDKMRVTCELAARVLETVGEQLKIGMTTDDIDAIVHDMTIANDAYPSPLTYKNFPKSVCTSVNNVACHGIPDDRKLEDGDIINVDVTVYKHGVHGDCSKTFLIGNVDALGQHLVKTTEECLEKAIEFSKPGVTFSDLGAFIETYADRHDVVVLPQFAGHGIGRYFHGPPDIFHVETNYPGVMRPGMTFTIEPVLGHGTNLIQVLDDGWTCVTTDNSRTAQFEHTVLVTERGCEILTRAEKS